jgi:GMP synthase (glutamine-hydrolysing)
VQELRATPRVVVIEHEPGCPLDRFTGWLDGLAVDVVRPYAGDAVPLLRGGSHGAGVVDGIVVLGGQMSAYDDDVAPWLPATRDLLRDAVATGRPALGICLGAQLLAVAAGGKVEVGAAPGRESGVVDVRWRPEARDDPLVAGLADPFPGPSMHADAIVDLPADAVWLASSGLYPCQALRVGAAAWGVQFHPEVSLSTFRGWAEHLADVDTETVTAELQARDTEVAAAGRALARRFAGLVADRRSPLKELR